MQDSRIPGAIYLREKGVNGESGYSSGVGRCSICRKTSNMIYIYKGIRGNLFDAICCSEEHAKQIQAHLMLV